MLKSERQRSILNLCEQYGVITVQFVRKNLQVSDMTIRRDLEELAQQDKIIRVHGGAQSKTFAAGKSTVIENAAIVPLDDLELSHLEKKRISIEEKNYIAKQAVQFIDSGDTIFLGSGTTIELMTKYLMKHDLRVVTNSLPVFNLLQENEQLDLYLVGGSYRQKTGAFVGSIANETIQKLSIEKAFVGVNGVREEYVSTFSIEEGKFQQLVLNQAKKRYLVADAHKFNQSDFYNFFNLRDIDALFTDKSIEEAVKNKYQQYTTIYS
ncbi:DeoR/GlpR family DNA-binding transcription regulator [Enterococcus montenegrensis]|uniref:DeoR/GlpR family DNA-binding transcription regulator n=1 Tax=Enterococcus montenegrensis TaxID=3031993 RepID=UPI00249E2FF1|nr:DeoR/GlpR family DNA-binding transcription regulator [Enterococcus montenegrensis]WHA09661.1 DeoR/GlpR family DNA-binding transcription regulator [Enterococcus montenegrensis]